jgi:O-methyltransferase
MAEAQEGSLSTMARGAVRTAKALGAGPLWRGISGVLPESVRGWVKRASIRSTYDRPLVPAQELQQAYARALRLLRDRGAAPGDYLEFGVCHGTSMLSMHRAVQDLGVAGVRLFGFDSFEGLPPEADTDDEGLWPKGAFASDHAYTRERLTRGGVDWNRTFLIKGWFSDTLNDRLVREHRLKRAGVIMVDSDIYTSAVQALAFCEPLIVDTSVVFFDDWHSGGLAEKNLGEKKAWDEFLAKHRHFEVEDLESYSEGSKAFVIRRRR